MYKLVSILENETHKFSGFEMDTDHPIHVRKPDGVLINKEKRIFQLDFAFPTVRMKEREKIENYLYLEIDLKNLGNMKVSVIPTVVGGQVTVTKKKWKK